MSSITYIKQTEPFEIYGAALRVKPKFHDEEKVKKKGQVLPFAYPVVNLNTIWQDL